MVALPEPVRPVRRMVTPFCPKRASRSAWGIWLRARRRVLLAGDWPPWAPAARRAPCSGIIPAPPGVLVRRSVVIEGHGGEGLVELAVVGDDRLDLAALAGGQGDDLVTLAEDPGRHGAAEAAEVEVGAEDVLHGEAHVGEVAVGGDVDGLEVREQRRALVPGHGGALCGDRGALERGHGGELHGRGAEPWDETRGG